MFTSEANARKRERRLWKTVLILGAFLLLVLAANAGLVSRHGRGGGRAGGAGGGDQLEPGTTRWPPSAPLPRPPPHRRAPWCCSARIPA